VLVQPFPEVDSHKIAMKHVQGGFVKTQLDSLPVFPAARVACS
jgi:hypothetical protein